MMGIVEKSGGRKWWATWPIVLTVCAVLVIVALRNKLDALLTTALGGFASVVVGLFGKFNTDNNKAALEAGKKARDETEEKLDALDDADIVDAAGAIDAVRGATDGAVESVRAGTTEAIRQLRAETNAAIERLRAAAKDSGAEGGK